MKRNGKTLRNSLLAVVGLLLAVIGFMIFSIMNRQEPVEVPVETEAVAAETAAAEVPEETVPVEVTAPVAREYRVVETADGIIATPYGDLTYPQGLSDHLLVVCTAEEPYTLEFCAVMEGRQELRLFDLAFGEAGGGNMGMAVTEQGEVPLNLTIYTLATDETWTEGEILTAQAMQDAVNELLAQLMPQQDAGEAPEDVVQEQPREDVTLHNLEFETPYGMLYYPARWTGLVEMTWEDNGDGIYRAYFYGAPEGREGKRLFAIYFGGDEGEQLGAVMGPEEIPVPVYLVMGQPDTEGWTAEETEILWSMQEDANQLIAKLPLLQ